MKKLLLILLVALTFSTIASADFKDMPDDWSTVALQTAVDNNLLNGDNGCIYPNRPLTRAEMATVITRAFGATKKADLSRFSDITTSKWYYDEMSLAVAMGVFEGDGNKLRSEDAITREEAFVVIARAFSLKENNTNSLNGFKDGSTVSSWAKPYLSALAKEGYVKGSNESLYPKNKITRAEFAQLMYNLVGTYLTSDTDKSINGNVIVKRDITLKNMTVNGDVVISDGVNGAVRLENVTVNGRLIFRAGNLSVIDGRYSSVILLGDGINVTVTADSTIKEQIVTGSDSSVTHEKKTSTTSSKPTTPSTPNTPTVPSTPDTPEDVVSPEIVDDAGKWSEWYD